MLSWTALVRWCLPVLLLYWSWFSHSLCADVQSLSCPYVFQAFYVHIFYSLCLQWCQYYLGLYWVECLLVIHESNTQWYVVFTALLFLNCFMVCMWSVVEYLFLNPACSLCWFSSSFFSSLVVIIVVNSLYTFLIASKLVCSSWCLFSAVFCSISWKISPYLLPSMF